MDKTKERISLILEPMAMFLLFRMTFSLVTAVVVYAILESTPDFSSQLFKATDNLKFMLCMAMSVKMPLALFVISWVFSAQICRTS